jgi:hypothetical protein
MTNVVAFPKAHKDAPAQSLEEVIERVSENRKEHINHIVDDLGDFFVSRAYEEGFPIDAEDCLKDVILVIEAMRSAMYKSIGLEHPMQFVVDNVISLGESDDEPLTDEQIENIEELTKE